MEQLANKPITSLNGSITNVATTLVVTDASKFPTAGNFPILIESEILRVTSVSGTTFTVSRGQEGTSGAAHTSGVTIKGVFTANSLSKLFTEQYQVGAYSSRPSVVRSGTTYRASDIDLGWQYDGTHWNLEHPLPVPYAKRVDLSGWTSLNLGSTTWTDFNGVLCVTYPAETTLNIRGYYHTIPAAPYTLNMIAPTPVIGVTDTLHSIFLYDGTKVKAFGLDSLNFFTAIEVTTWTNVTGTVVNLNTSALDSSPYVWLKLEDDNTNLNYYFSTDGLTYTKIYTEARNTFLTPTGAGLAITRNNNAPNVDLFSKVFAYWEA